VIGIHPTSLLNLIRGIGRSISPVLKMSKSLTENKTMIAHATEYYKKLFGEEPKNNMCLGCDFWGAVKRSLQRRTPCLKLSSQKRKLRKP
jgi:hypothetical protein